MAFGVEATTVTGGSATNPSDTIASGSLTVTNANLLLAAVSIGTSNPGSQWATMTVTWDGTDAMSEVAGSPVDDGAWTAIRWYRRDNPTPGTGTVVVDFGTPDPQQQVVAVIGFIDADLTLGTPSTNTGSTANPSVTVADSANGDIVVAAMATDGSAGATTEAETLIFEVEDLGSDSDHSSQYKTATGASTAMSWTNATTGETWSASGFAVSSGVAGAASNAVPLLDDYYRMISG